MAADAGWPCARGHLLHGYSHEKRGEVRRLDERKKRLQKEGKKSKEDNIGGERKRGDKGVWRIRRTRILEQTDLPLLLLSPPPPFTIFRLRADHEYCCQRTARRARINEWKELQSSYVQPLLRESARGGSKRVTKRRDGWIRSRLARNNEQKLINPLCNAERT